MKSNINLEFLIDYLDNTIKIKNYNFDYISKIFNQYFINIYKYYFDRQKKYDNQLIYEIRDYAMLDGGKRLRPFLMFLTAYCLNDKNLKDIEPFMLSIELIHAYSLIHDDLPCMDNDEIRRGKASVWAKYGEDLGVLSGDSLLTDSFKIIFDNKINDYKKFVKNSYLLSNAASSCYLINGQIIDINNTYENSFSENKIIKLYECKTGALFGAAIEIASINTKINNKFNEDMRNIGIMLGVAFQIQDDLLEISENNLNKPKDSDVRNNKNTYISKVGIEKSIKKIEYYLKSIDFLIDKYIKNKSKNRLYKDFIKYMIKY